jgi:hypothetical protein
LYHTLAKRPAKRLALAATHPLGKADFQAVKKLLEQNEPTQGAGGNVPLLGCED